MHSAGSQPVSLCLEEGSVRRWMEQKANHLQQGRISCCNDIFQINKPGELTARSHQEMTQRAINIKPNKSWGRGMGLSRAWVMATWAEEKGTTRRASTICSYGSNRAVNLGFRQGACNLDQCTYVYKCSQMAEQKPFISIHHVSCSELLIKAAVAV